MAEICECTLCDLGRQLTSALESHNYQRCAPLLKKFANLWLLCDFDRQYYKMILDGTWPQSVEILERSLERAKKIRNDDNY